MREAYRVCSLWNDGAGASGERHALGETGDVAEKRTGVRGFCGVDVRVCVYPDNTRVGVFPATREYDNTREECASS